MGWATWSALPGRIAVRGGITNAVESEARRQIAWAHREGVEELMVGIQSPGGNVRSAYRICNDLIGVGKPITARVLGWCGSASTSILAAAGKRIGRPSDQLLFHRAVRDLPATRDLSSSDLRAMARDLDDLDQRYRSELVGLGLAPHIIAAATSKTGWSIDGRTGFAHRILTDLEPDR
jgi:ATP-dependent protease ClpP protease subunit